MWEGKDRQDSIEGGLAQLDFKTYCKVTVIKTCGIGKYTHRSTDLRIESM